jgi:HlyD family secretion protein
LEIRAPTDGIVKDLALTSAGAVVQAGALLLNLVPQGESVQAEVLVANEDVGFVNVGQAVQLKVAAYPFQKYGLLQGTVTHLSADAQDARQQANTAGLNTNLTAMVNGSQTYRALIKLDQQTLNGPGGKPLLLSPGMQVTAELHQGRRTVIEYLLSPVQKVTAEAARER